MASKDPKFVRLREGLSTGCVGDTSGSGWFIGGLDVQPFPEDDDFMAQRFVREKVRAGLLEEATESEHGIVQSAASDMRALHLGQLDEHEAHDRQGHQEQQIQTMAAQTQRKLVAARHASEQDNEDDEEEADTSQARRVRKGTGRQPGPSGSTDPSDG